MPHPRNPTLCRPLLHWSLYGLAAGMLAATMAWAKYRLLMADGAYEFYGLIVAVLFAALGIWLGLRLSKPKTIVQREVVVKEVFVPAEITAASPAPAPATTLSAREMDVLRLLSKGHSNAEIAAELFVSLNTVKTHVSNLLFKLDAKRRTQAADRARALGLI